MEIPHKTRQVEIFFSVTLIKICDNNGVHGLREKSVPNTFGKCICQRWKARRQNGFASSSSPLPLHNPSRLPFPFVSHFRPAKHSPQLHPNTYPFPPQPPFYDLVPNHSISLFFSIWLSRPHSNYYKSESQSIFNPRGMVLAVDSKWTNGTERGMGWEGANGWGGVEFGRIRGGQVDGSTWKRERGRGGGSWSLQQCQ